ncbi:MAG: hypothetical protein R3E95_01760 [Thiolinea sp.]
MATKQNLGSDKNFAEELHDVEDELSGVEDELHEFEARQSGISRTLQIIVYPSLVAFVVLAAYGFYLVQSLTTDVHRLTETIVDMNGTVHHNLQNMSAHMDSMSTNMNSVTQRMDELSKTTRNMGSNVAQMNDSTRQMSSDVGQMNISTQNMAASTYNMQRDMWSMNKNVSKPFKMMGKFMPFGNSSTQPYMVAPPPTPYYGAYGWTYPSTPQATPVSTEAGAQPAVSTQPAVQQQSLEVVPGMPSLQEPPATNVTGEGQSFFKQAQITNLVSSQ